MASPNKGYWPTGTNANSTWLSSYITDSILDPRGEFNIVRKDRQNCRGGGVCAIVRKCLSIISLCILDMYQELEVVGFDLINITSSVRVFAVYQPPHYDQVDVDLVNTLVSFLVRYATGANKQHVIVGDLNLPRINWNASTCHSDMVHRPVLDFAVNFGFSQLVDFNTRGDNLIDVILTDDSMLIAKVGALRPIWHSDHLVVEFTVSVNLQVNSTSYDPSADDVKTVSMVSC